APEAIADVLLPRARRGGRFIRWRNAPEVVARASHVPCPAERGELQRIGWHVLPMRVARRTREVNGGLTTADQHDRGDDLTRVFRAEKRAIARRWEGLQ